MRTSLYALLLFACGTSQDVQDAAATNDASADVATESAFADVKDASATMGLPRVYIGASDGSIHVCSFDTQTFALAPIDATATGGNPSFLAFDSARAFLYAVDETNSNVLAFSIDKTTGKLTSIGKVSSLGSGPAHVGLDRKDGFVMAANYGGGTIAVYPRGADGKLADASAATYSFGANAHSHEILTDPSNAFVVVPNLGLNGVGVFRRDAGALSYLGLTPAAGARHMVFNAAGTFAYVIDEPGSDIFVFSFDAGSGALSQLQITSSLYTSTSSQNTGAEIAMTSDGAHVLASNRGDDSIVVFDVAQDGKLTAKARVATGGKTPRHFSIDETGRFLFVGNQTSNTIVTMTMDAQSGVPSPVGSPLNVTGPEFVALVYLQ